MAVVVVDWKLYSDKGILMAIKLIHNRLELICICVSRIAMLSPINLQKKKAICTASDKERIVLIYGNSHFI